MGGFSSSFHSYNHANPRFRQSFKNASMKLKYCVAELNQRAFCKYQTLSLTVYTFISTLNPIAAPMPAAPEGVCNYGAMAVFSALCMRLT
jgi:hypothetical protein